jgi:hypothetical protein
VKQQDPDTGLIGRPTRTSSSTTTRSRRSRSSRRRTLGVRFTPQVRAARDRVPRVPPQPVQRLALPAARRRQRHVGHGWASWPTSRRRTSASTSTSRRSTTRELVRLDDRRPRTLRLRRARRPVVAQGRRPRRRVPAREGRVHDRGRAAVPVLPRPGTEDHAGDEAARRPDPRPAARPGSRTGRSTTTTGTTAAMRSSSTARTRGTSWRASLEKAVVKTQRQGRQLQGLLGPDRPLGPRRRARLLDGDWGSSPSRRTDRRLSPGP